MFTGATRFRIGLLGLGGFLRFFFVRSSGLPVSLLALFEFQTAELSFAEKISHCQHRP